MLNLRSKILIVAVALVVVCQFTTMGLVMMTIKNNITENAIEELDNSANLVAGITNSQSVQAASIIKALTGDPAFQRAIIENDAERLELMLANQNNRAGAAIAFLFDDRQTIIADSGKDVPRNQILATLSQNENAGSSIPMMLELNGTPHYVVTVPVDGTTNGAWLSMAYPIDANYINRVQELIGLQMSIYEMTSDGPRLLVGALPRDLEADARALMQSTAGSNRREAGQVLLGGHEYLATVRPFVRQYEHLQVLITEPIAQALSMYSLIRNAGVALTLIPLLVALIIAIPLSRSLTSPIMSLVSAAKRIQVGNYEETVVIDSDDEFNEFAVAFNAMQKEIATREENIIYQAHFDSVSGLYNRDYAMDSLSAAIRNAETNAEPLSVMVVSLNARQQISGALGHHIADQYLRAAADRIKSFVNNEYVIAKLELDSFMIVMPQTDVIGAKQIGDEMVERLAAGIRLDDVNVSVRTRIGIAAFPEHGNSRDKLMLRATIAKGDEDSDQRAVSIYREGDEEQRVRNLSLLHDLRKAASENALVMHYQPVINVADETVRGAEALIRWNHPVYGWLPPNEFIPLIEQSGNISVVTRWALETVSKQYRQWVADGLDLDISVNFSAHDLMDNELPWFIMDILRDSKLPPNKLVAEITEQAMVQDIDNATKVLTRLRDLGIRIAIDDFGTGYSSLSHLKRLPVDELKIDRSFVASLTENPADAAIVSTAIDLAHKLDLKIVAEGVGNGKVYRWLQSHGIDRAQGFYWSKPMPGVALAEWAENFSGGSTMYMQALDPSKFESA